MGASPSPDVLDPKTHTPATQTTAHQVLKAQRPDGLPAAVGGRSSPGLTVQLTYAAAPKGILVTRPLKRAAGWYEVTDDKKLRDAAQAWSSAAREVVKVSLATR